jgi:hypothetical protein
MSAMKIRSTIKAGALTSNHNQKLVRAKVKSGVRAGTKAWGVIVGTLAGNHNESLVRR